MRPYGLALQWLARHGQERTDLLTGLPVAAVPSTKGYSMMPILVGRTESADESADISEVLEVLSDQILAYSPKSS
jgi:hypothetical protein